MHSHTRRVLSRRSMITSTLSAGAAAAVAAPGLAWAVPVPEITACAQWGARPPMASTLVLAGPPQRIVIHHTATANVHDLTQARAFTLARAIQTHHMDDRGWADTGQHFTVSRGAFVMEGRHRSLNALRAGTAMVRGAHCTGHNGTSIGIETEGTYTSASPLAAQYRSLVELCARICLQYRLAPSEVYGHRDFNPTVPRRRPVRDAAPPARGHRPADR